MFTRSRQSVTGPGGFIAGLIALLVVGGCAAPEIRLAHELESQEKWDAAVTAYRKALSKDPFDAELKARYAEVRVRAAEQHYVQGRRFLKEDKLTEALDEFNFALALDPTKSEHHAALTDVARLKSARDKLHGAEKLQSLGRFDEAIERYEEAVELDPDLTRALEGITTLTERQREEKVIGAGTEPITLRFQNAKVKEIFEVLGKAKGLNIIFDKGVKDEPVTIFIKDTPFQDALNLILSINNLFYRKIGPDTLLIIPDTKEKHAQYEDQMIRTFYLSNAKAKDMVPALKAIIDTRRMHVIEPVNAIVVRDQPDKLRLAERIIQAADRRDSEVEFEIEVLEVSRTRSLEYGIDYAKNVGAGVFPPGTTSFSTLAQQYTSQQLANLGTSTLLFVLPTSATMKFAKTDSDARTLASPKVRVANNKKAVVNLGDKQPILLSTTNVLPGQAATGAVPTTSTVTSIEYKDTGIKFTIEPVIHLEDEITLRLQIEITRLGDRVVLQTDPLIQQFRFGTRTADTTLNINDGETVVLAGLIQDEDRQTKASIPGLGDIPVLGQIFTTTQIDRVSTEIVITLTPRLIRNLTPASVENQAFWSGTEANFATEPMFTDVSRKVRHKPPAKVSPPAPASGKPTGPPSASSTVTPPTGSTIPSTPEVGAGADPSAQSGPAAGAPLPGASGQTVTPPTGPAVPSSAQPPGGPIPPAAATAPPVTQPPLASQAPPAPQAPIVVAGGATVLALRPPDVSAAVGQEFPIEVTVERIENLKDTTVRMTYDPNVMEFKRAVEGELLRRDGSSVSIAVGVSPQAGRVELLLRRKGAPVSGGGVLGTVFFQAKTPGTSAVEVNLSPAGVAGSAPITMAPGRGTVQVRQ